MNINSSISVFYFIHEKTVPSRAKSISSIERKRQLNETMTELETCSK